VTFEDQSPVTATLRLDGAAFVSGTAVTTEGEHTLVIEAGDIFGNQGQLTIRFTLDKTRPVLTLSGVSDGEILGGPVTLTWSSTDLQPGTTVGTLDFAPITSGATVSASGWHVWTVHATDGAGNVTTETRGFTLE
jgi:large repetitive protein